ncbi:MAG: hypothetical protein PHC61_06740 [Chitinivibrionales bacterium]|nr:hypothetical protein [Chitinivibrionales bacterium]
MKRNNRKHKNESAEKWPTITEAVRESIQDFEGLVTETRNSFNKPPYKDPVVEEVRKVREKIMKEYDYDPHAFGRFLAQREKRHRPKRIKTTRRQAFALVH